MILILALALLGQLEQGSPAEVAEALRELGCWSWRHRERAQDTLTRACWQRATNLNSVAAALDSPDAEVRWRAAAVIQTTRPCGTCHRTAGWWIDDKALGGTRGLYWVVCWSCQGSGTSWSRKTPS